MSVNEKMTTIADAIRDKTGGTDLLGLDDMANAVEDVYAAGKKAEYDAFWDAYQDNGRRTNYQKGFGGFGWTKEIFRPKYDIVPKEANELFRDMNYDTMHFDLVEHLKECGVKLDFSKATNMGAVFHYSCFTHVGVIDCTNVTSAGYLFGHNSSLKKVDELIVDEQFSFLNVFNGTTALEDITITGTIAKGDLNMSSCKKLTRDSINSVLGALSPNTTGLSITLSKTAVDREFANMDEAGNITTNGSETVVWLVTVDAIDNWNIVLA